MRDPWTAAERSRNVSGLNGSKDSDLGSEFILSPSVIGWSSRDDGEQNVGRVRAVMQHSLVRGVGGRVGSCRGARAGIAVPAGKVTRGDVQADPVAYPQ